MFYPNNHNTLLTPSIGDGRNYINTSTTIHHLEQHTCSDNVIPRNGPEQSNESTLSSNGSKDVKPTDYLASVHSPSGTECNIVPRNGPEQSNESTPSSNGSIDVKPTDYLASVHSPSGTECNIVPRNGPEQSNESTPSSNGSIDSNPGSILTNSSAQCNSNASSSTMVFSQEGQVVSNTVSRQSSDLPCDRNGDNKAGESTVQLAPSITSSVNNNNVQSNKHGNQVHHPSGVKPLSTQLSAVAINVNDVQPANIRPANHLSAGSLVSNALSSHTPTRVYRKVHPDFQHLVAKRQNTNIPVPVLPKVNMSSRNMFTGNVSSASNNIHPDFQHLVAKRQNTNIPVVPVLPKVNMSSRNMFTGNVSSASNNIHPDFQHLMAKRQNTNIPVVPVLPKVNMSSRNMFTGNVSSASNNIHPDFQHLVAKRQNTNIPVVPVLPKVNMSSTNMFTGNVSSASNNIHPDFQHLVANKNTNRLPTGNVSSGSSTSFNGHYFQPEDQPYKCSTCSMRFSSEKEYNNHTALHYENCPYCSEVLNSRTPNKDLLKHVVLFHKDQDPCSLAHKSTVIRASRGSSPGHFRCCHCGDEFDSLRACLEHRVYSHMVKECWVCQKMFTTIYNLKNHVKTHTGEKTYHCPHCPKSFATTSSRASHSRRHTGNVLRCEHCSFICLDKNNLELHQNKHTGAKPYKCQFCPMAYGQPGRLKLHERSHTGEKPYACDQCDKAFIDKYSLVRHVRTHTGEKPYKCSHCNKGFAQGCQLQFHERTHTGEKPYECSHCEKKFTRRQELNKHLATHKKRKRETKSKRTIIVENDSDSEFSADDMEDVEQDREERRASLRSAKQSTKKRRFKL